MRGPKPYYQPTFSQQDIDLALTLVKKHNTPQTKAQRARLALLLNEQPDIDCVTAANELGMHEQWVRMWRRRWVNEGFTLEDMPRSGRPPRFSPSGESDGKSYCM